ncbi:hypothetical protein OAU08_00200 [Porticoccaceae bacterium]|nr:hypothetical protein [Porticoccaceae bacterium]MDC3248629.1 hypothetical protein [Porticoccaceae bacterium]
MDNRKNTKRPSPIEKRHKNRRVIPDRREEVRFEPLKEDRRQNSGRRATDRDVCKPIN